MNARTLASYTKQVLIHSQVCVAFLEHLLGGLLAHTVRYWLDSHLLFSEYTKSVTSLGMKEILPLVGVVGSFCYEITGYFVQGARFPFDLAMPLLNSQHFQKR